MDSKGTQSSMTFWSRFYKIIEPNASVAPFTMKMLALFWMIVMLIAWTLNPFRSLPTPMETIESLRDLWQQGLAVHIWTSAKLNFNALIYASLISLGLAYLTPVPLVRPLASMISAMRFLGLTGFTLIFTLVMGGGYQFRITLIVMSITYFYLTTMMQVVASIPNERFDDAATLRMGKWRSIWEVIIVGNRHEAIEALRQNAAIGWMMLTMVEGLSRSGGGIGVLLRDNDKHFALADIYAIQLVILFIGVCFDFMLQGFKRLIAPYANLTLVRR